MKIARILTTSHLSDGIHILQDGVHGPAHNKLVTLAFPMTASLTSGYRRADGREEKPMPS